MSPADVSAPFPFNSLVLEDVLPSADIFDRILEGREDMAGFVFGYCVASPSRSDEPPRYLLLFHRKPYSAGRITPNADLNASMYVSQAGTRSFSGLAFRVPGVRQQSVCQRADEPRMLGIPRV